MALRILIVVLVLVGLPVRQAASELMHHIAENQVPVVITEVRRFSNYTEIYLTTLESLRQVCWSFSGQNSPYLLSEGTRYRFMGGENITRCPTTRAYIKNETMILRFNPLGNQVRKFHLVEGEGGENQLIDPSSSKTRYWNFLNVILK